MKRLLYLLAATLGGAGGAFLGTTFPTIPGWPTRLAVGLCAGMCSAAAVLFAAVFIEDGGQDR